MDDDEVIQAKLILLGDQWVGKTSMIKAYKGIPFDDHEKPSIGASFTAAVASSNGNKVNLAIWDTAGQEAYQALAPTYYRDANMAFIVYAVNDQKSFESVERWVTKVHEICPEIKMLICGNKIDLETERVVSDDQLENLAEKLGIQKYIEVSAKTKEGIQEAFQSLIDEYANALPLNEKPIKPAKVEETKTKGKKFGCCQRVD